MRQFGLLSGSKASSFILRAPSILQQGQDEFPDRASELFITAILYVFGIAAIRSHLGDSSDADCLVAVALLRHMGKVRFGSTCGEKDVKK
jgi:hypothetical protein